MTAIRYFATPDARHRATPSRAREAFPLLRPVQRPLTPGRGDAPTRRTRVRSDVDRPALLPARRPVATHTAAGGIRKSALADRHPALPDD